MTVPPAKEGGVQGTRLDDDVAADDVATDDVAPEEAPAAARPKRASEVIDDPRLRRAFNGFAAIFAFYWVIERLWPSPAGVILKGMVIGGLYALIALGLALVYRANRIINFAQGDLGGAPAAMAVLLIVSLKWPYPLAMLAGLAGGVALGVVIEFVVI